MGSLVLTVNIDFAVSEVLESDGRGTYLILCAAFDLEAGLATLFLSVVFLGNTEFFLVEMELASNKVGIGEGTLDGGLAGMVGFVDKTLHEVDTVDIVSDFVL